MNWSAQESVPDWYARHLNSPGWLRLRGRVLARAAHRCEACLAAPAVEVHHLSYDNVGHEFAHELIAVCSECHRRLHPPWTLRPPTATTRDNHHSHQEQHKDNDMPSFRAAFSNRYLKHQDVSTADLTVTIAACRQEHVGNGPDADKRWVLYFKECDKVLALNRTNGSTIAKLYGDDMDSWVGQPVTLYATETSFAGELVPCIRIRSTPPRRAASPTAAGDTPHRRRRRHRILTRDPGCHQDATWAPVPQKRRKTMWPTGLRRVVLTTPEDGLRRAPGGQAKPKEGAERS